MSKQKIQFKKYDKAYKEKAIKIYLENNKNIKNTAKDLKIPYSTFFEWVQKSGVNKKLLNSNLSKEKIEILNLKQQLKDITEERDILKKGLAILTKR